MKWPIIGRGDDKSPAPLYVRLLWMVAIWAASVGLLALIGSLIRIILLRG